MAKYRDIAALQSDLTRSLQFSGSNLSLSRQQAKVHEREGQVIARWDQRYLHISECAITEETAVALANWIIEMTKEERPSDK